jgi:hypothetical protein
MKRPFSRRLANRHSPCVSRYSALIKSPRRPLKQKTWPENDRLDLHCQPVHALAHVGPAAGQKHLHPGWQAPPPSPTYLPTPSLRRAAIIRRLPFSGLKAQSDRRTGRQIARLRQSIQSAGANARRHCGSQEQQFQRCLVGWDVRQRLKYGVFKGIVDLQAAINRFLAETNKTNQNPKPFTWTADPDAIITTLPIPARRRQFGV